MSRWRVLQLADSAFPVGGFAHSGGLEAMAQAGELRDAAALERFVGDVIWQAARGGLPIVAAAHASAARLDELDALSQAILWSEVAGRASRAQGRAFLDTATRIFPVPELGALRKRLSARELHGHLAPLFGRTTAALDVGLEDARATFLHLALRGALSAAVRLGLAGPYEAQAIQDRCAPVLDRALHATAGLGTHDVAQTAPLAELFQGCHDRLYSRLFQS